MSNGDKTVKPYYEDESCTIYHGDCREVLPMIDKVDLVMMDPPYGINAGDQRRQKSRTNLAKAKDYGPNEWDLKPAPQNLIDLIITVGEKSCIWGGNYYGLEPSPSWLVWDKLNGKNDFADCELAWTNYGSAVRIKRHMWNGMLRVNREARFHPTQKPLDVINWAISLCPNEPQTILDPFMGSGTTLRAAKDLNRKAIGIELEEKYCEIAAKRLAQEVFAL